MRKWGGENGKKKLNEWMTCIYTHEKQIFFFSSTSLVSLIYKSIWKYVCVFSRFDRMKNEKEKKFLSEIQEPPPHSFIVRCVFVSLSIFFRKMAFSIEYYDNFSEIIVFFNLFCKVIIFNMQTIIFRWKNPNQTKHNEDSSNAVNTHIYIYKRKQVSSHKIFKASHDECRDNIIERIVLH